ncbi:hypothetical protein G6F57_015007 [Rhizopus arrhizus]|uniref:Uncharacterized protein n=1 Tax=Rhizopus oryzae TaxID=64495 RepID=A0A9P6WXT4_RHIOR|nr:hypothetical protein G6F23_012061 [Rhizopus arrhizus]KAG0750726.1 hypothetical protein G6F24_015002 [Rhizopus arrhizus]KAG0769426.1 hypothetical protein G6F22_017371 [Rhizopus arrhizus]KAG0783700.1 hypothetical protein G6F21_010375 [Rhizopus arrhizus]KAG0804517.1 hypothetical protein G6F20_012631 [Rhizopus arrhizus]
MDESANIVYKDYFSYMGPVEEDDQVLNFFPWTSLVDYYDPDTNGWCGYCCVGWATGIFEQDLADSSGTIIREMLKETLQEFRKQFLAFFGRDDYMQVVDTLTRTPDNTTDWWFSAPACLWVAVVTFRTSFFFADIAYQQAYLHRCPGTVISNSTVPCLLLLHRQHIHAYQVRNYTHSAGDDDLEQVNFDLIFGSILS